jgi:alpha-tubulin suppressor-like RCC1 family protein
MANFVTPTGEDLTSNYITDFDILERYVGNQLWAWGGNSFGQLGSTNLSDQPSPVQTVSGGTNWKQVSATVNSPSFYSAAIKSDGSLWMWGKAYYGEFGINANYPVLYSSPIQTIAGGTNWKYISVSAYNCAAIKTDGTMWGWGQGMGGQVGTGSAGNWYSPVQSADAGKNWKSVCCGSGRTAGIKTDGTLWLWGANSYGELGISTATTNVYSPIQTTVGGTSWKQVGVGTYHTAAIKTDGTLWSFGRNNFGQLGDGTISDKYSAVQTSAGGTNWKQVACSGGTTVAIKTDGTLWTWGLGTSGELGDNTATRKSNPGQTVAGGTNWKTLATLEGASINVSTSIGAIKTDGTLWMWGSNASAQLGISDYVDRSSPVQTSAGGSNWKSLACGGSFTLAVTFTES